MIPAAPLRTQSSRYIPPSPPQTAYSSPSALEPGLISAGPASSFTQPDVLGRRSDRCTTPSAEPDAEVRGRVLDHDRE